MKWLNRKNMPQLTKTPETDDEKISNPTLIHGIDI